MIDPSERKALLLSEEVLNLIAGMRGSILKRRTVVKV